jgi:predicted permease
MDFDIRPRIRRAFRLAVGRSDLTRADIDEELRGHLALRIAQLEARGLTRADAEREALERLGGSWEEAYARLRDAAKSRDERLRLRERLDAARSDLTYAARTLTRQPGFAFVVVLTFALGVGANATMFGVVDRLLLRPPPEVGDPAGVFEVARIHDGDGRREYYTAMPYPLYAQLRADTAAFREVSAASYITTQSLGTGADAEQAVTVFVSSNYFRVLRTQPALGRFFGPAEDGEQPSSDVAVVSYAFWRRHFTDERSPIGKTVRIGPRDFSIVGVARDGFTGVDPRAVDVWLPLSHAQVFGASRPGATSNWGTIWLAVHARLQPGLTSQAAAARVRTWYTAGMAAWTSERRRPAPRQLVDATFAMRSILPSTQLADDPKAKLARLLIGVTAVVLLIACANVASLLLARGTERRREIAVRLALGVSRRRLVRLLLAETAVLALAGGVIALFVAHWGIALLQATLLDQYAWTASPWDSHVLLATFALVGATVALAGVVPALRASRPGVVDSLKAGGREGGVAVSRLRGTLMIAQAALSVILVVGAGLFVRSLQQAAHVHLGFEPTGVLAGSIDVTPLGYKAPSRLALYESMRARVASLPGVAGVAYATTYPMQGFAVSVRVRVPGLDSVPAPSSGLVTHNEVSAGFFSTLGIPIRDGRPIIAADVGSVAHVAVLSEAMARAYWPGESAVGRCIILNGDQDCTTIIGVAADTKESIDRTDERWIVYVPAGPAWPVGPTALLVRARDGHADRLIPPVRHAMQSAAANLPYADVRTLDDVFAPEIRPWRTGATLFSLFGALALVIAAMGLYSAISYSVVQRRHEFGVRIALGARIRDVVRLVMDQGIQTAVIGTVMGSLAALSLGGAIAPLLFKTSPREPAAFALAAVVIVVVAALASFVPAWRASRVDPVAALRGD